ncbi:hypothetical protein A3F02_02265 [Candidatus Curtissbacteria bacterium RIFCSPHIGHO2_12_FULL_38_9b]|uniref:Uncharacterized protein n=2 Tax=Candidatus Curtissiibacteriota TaxID=1752717 RepID=A0A1F5GY78_9BACT|nr:MAG: hypothetical protein A3A48_01850 [Candidatus Curtissbacteria bacterium RIFCSPLOWO2_01_FULL_37_9]OGD96727.1 MAG: hypothetical protein A3F02_02265 [Candidatus Curtissbacteria bacterium RIFCSPHIGHO2_12_FULL_38_9b]
MTEKLFRNIPDRVNSSNKIEDAADGKNCQHYWKIESPQGEMSLGICKHCKAQNLFRNYSSEIGQSNYQFNNRAVLRKLYTKNMFSYNKINPDYDDGGDLDG